MREISISPYQLQSKASLNAKVQGSGRHGVLLRVNWDDGLTGYADLHPWTELGDLSLHEQLEKLKEGRPTVLSHSSLWLARRDAEARFAQKNLMPEKPTLKNNALVTSAIDLNSDFLHSLKVQGFDCVKVKMGRDLKAEAHHLRSFLGSSWKVRLDFNGVLDENTYADFIQSLPADVRGHIEYVEDPFPFHEKSWARVRKWAPLAVDQDLFHVIKHTHAPFDVVILKPAKSDVAESVQFAQKHDCKITVTSYMDHPVGVMHAIAVAEDLAKEFGDRILEAGCLTTPLFVENLFSVLMEQNGPFISATPGFGVGFDRALEGLSWQKLAPL